MTTIDKISVIGGGSTYAPEFVDGFIQHRDEVSIGEVVLYDINQVGWTSLEGWSGAW